jgi:hypothetical protein
VRDVIVEGFHSLEAPSRGTAYSLTIEDDNA